MMHLTLGNSLATGVAAQPRIRRTDLDDIRSYIERNYAERLALEDLADRAGLSVFRFVTLFRRRFGVSPYRFLSMVRVQAAQQLLLEGTPPAIAAIEVGFCDQSHLCRHFRSLCGTTPGRFLAARMELPVASNTNSRRAIAP
ncbi:MAG: AraC family transcriptional regulator [Beijerinckiaceae bacterium]|nr:AraC family transcriptional regulator [Beijerinckiaceae bacterium]MCZ8301691.1 AraC family transcriptional regulator [Beijerinckiaceae bacterium]